MGMGCLIVQISSLLIRLDEKQLFSEMLKKLLLLHSSEIDLSLLFYLQLGNSTSEKDLRLGKKLDKRQLYDTYGRRTQAAPGYIRRSTISKNQKV